MSRSQVLFLLLGILSLTTVQPALAEIVSTVLPLTAATDSENYLDITVEIELVGIATDSDVQRTSLTGFVEIDLEAYFNPVTHRVDDIIGITFVGGELNMSDHIWRMTYPFFGDLVASNSGISATPATPFPPGFVTGGEFSAADHTVTLDQGQFQVVGDGLLTGVISESINLATDNLVTTSFGMGTVEISLVKIAGTSATYDTTVTLPMGFQEEAFGNDQAIANVGGVGLIRASGQFVRIVPGPDTLTWDNPGDDDWDSSTGWDGGQPGDVPDADIHAEVLAGTVVVAADAAAHSLMVDGPDAALAIATNATLTVANNLEVADGSLQLAAAGSIQAGSVLLSGNSQLVMEIRGNTVGQIHADGDADIETGSTLQFEISAAEPFQAGTYMLIASDGEDGVIGMFDSTDGLGDYVGDTPLSIVGQDLVLTIDKDLNPGDADLSTATDLTDFNIWNANKFMSGTDWTTGDFNGDGTTDLSDFNIWNANKFTVAGGAAPAPQPVPEPGTLLLLIGAALALVPIWRPRS